ncbi:alpha/beta fold hydrolase [Paraburkholderia tropica]|uniref:Pimeloyl-ACP methyl ester carboxylesterase n=5 Tax=Paraburkholderia TaxID=1822464 RepID=A0ABX5MRN2_9BURK|nr:alpha/beta hydrolase [Paraburkholderia tropica]MBB2980406.1 pimeloyl-ACP methyl ester carboxylesterase [Paraburkholderia tropica]MBB3000336.1 pimeloyl-ACP methyl ester carboxylesterase [Paraburkholderia tropica]MBB6319966.1 pimeloyl-ACP methyl ester carboxylesterase [Paraburkholderia tropica]MDE1144589.1 alpha/beta hydrolase [Paraburkholderia tropica]OBR50699.1 alpha/beta hydrolase [Paraburkholderia tropica]
MISRTLPLSNNRAAHYLEQGAGEPLVLIHGVGMQAQAWYPQIEDLSRDFRVISVDMPGHGDSDALDANAGLQQFVAWAIEFIEALNAGPVNLAGHSMGSLIAAGVAVTRPDLVKRVAVLNGVYRRTQQARDAVLQRAAELRSGTIDIDTPLKRWFNADEAQRLAAQKVETWLKSVNIAGYATAYTAFARGDEVYADGWHTIACPALVLTGSDDPNSTPEMARQMAAAAHHGQAVVIDDERHMVNLTAPEAVNLALRAWLQTAPVAELTKSEV